MTRKIIHPNPASAPTAKVVGPAQNLKVVGPAPAAKVVGPNRTAAPPYRVDGKESPRSDGRFPPTGPDVNAAREQRNPGGTRPSYSAAAPKVVGPTAGAAVRFAGPAPGASVGPRPGASGAGAPVAPGAVVRPANGGNGHNGNGHNGAGTRRAPVLAPKERWLRVGEVAERFGVGPRTVKQWARKGRLPAIRTLGGHYRFPESAINEQIQASVPTAPAEAQDRLLRPGEIAELFSIDPRPVGRWAKQGRLPAVRTIGGHYRFPEAAVRALLWRLSPAERHALEQLEASQGHADTWPVSHSVARALASRGLVVINEAQASITKAGRQALAAARQAQAERARVARP